jgi:hypothetical protein
MIPDYPAMLCECMFCSADLVVIEDGRRICVAVVCYDFLV